MGHTMRSDPVWRRDDDDDDLEGETVRFLETGTYVRTKCTYVHSYAQQLESSEPIARIFRLGMSGEYIKDHAAHRM